MMKTLFITVLAVLAIQLRAQDLADLFDGSKQSVVTIYTSESENSGIGDSRKFTSSMGLGSGVLVREDLVLTAAHVVGNAEEIMVQFYDGEAISAKTVRLTRIADVALIQLTRSPKVPHIATLGNSDQTRIGESIYIIGAPMGLPYSLSTGVISGKEVEKNKTFEGKILEFFQTDASINTGNSGGPMYNMHGEVIGIVSSILSRSGGFEGIGFAATSEIARSLLSSKGSRYFGIDAMILSDELTKILNLPQESGWLVQHVVKNSPAGEAGLQGGFRRVTIDDQEILLGGDVILSVDDIPILGMENILELFKHLEAAPPDATHRITVFRAGEKLDLFWVSSDHL